MSINFIPTIEKTTDAIADSFVSFAQWILIILTAALPLVWLSPLYILTTPVKILLTTIFVLVAIVVTSLAVLRRGTLEIRLYAPLFVWWMVVFVAGLSAMVSPDLFKSLTGSFSEPNTVSFLFLLGLIMTVMSVFANNKKRVLLLLAAFVLSILVLAVFHVLRLLLGANTLTLGTLPSATDTVVGSWNDLGILFALTLVVLIIGLAQLQLSKRVQIALLVGASFLLFLLMVINITFIWYGLGFFSLALLLYTLTKDRFSSQSKAPSVLLMVALLVTTFVSGLYVIGGNTIGSYLAETFSISYVEVRPSFIATVDVAKQVLAENLWLGSGPNHFSEAWQQYRDPAIASTLFWNIDFESGSSYVLTWFVMTGAFGLIAWLLFMITVLYSGARVLIIGNATDKFWYFVATVAFTLSISIWVLALIYVPGPVILIIGAIATGLLFSVATSLQVAPLQTFSFTANNRTNFLLIGGSMVVILGSMVVSYHSLNQFSAVQTFAKITELPAEMNQMDTAIALATDAYSMYQTDSYLRQIAILQLSQANQILQIAEPSESDQQKFQSLLASAVQVATEATTRYPTNRENWLLLGEVYSLFVFVGIERDQAAQRAIDAFTQAKALSPTNPLPDYRIATMYFQQENTEQAKAAVQTALSIKPNFPEAIAFLTQLEIAAGNTEAAIESTRVLLSLNPSNSGLYYQLGLLHIANKDLTSAAGSLTDALQLDEQFANARYVRALVFAEQGDRSRALEELQKVRSLNEQNAIVDNIINIVSDEGQTVNVLELLTPVQEPTPVTQQDAVVSPLQPETDSLTTVNATNNRSADTVEVEATENQSVQNQETE
jgi:tetratricopeptide (TPR) repeat protein